MVAKASQDESGQEAGEGVEIVRNEPFNAQSATNRYNMPPGQYTYVLSSKFSFFSPAFMPDMSKELTQHQHYFRRPNIPHPHCILAQTPSASTIPIAKRFSI